jgi:hypothetical protein
VRKSGIVGSIITEFSTVGSPEASSLVAASSAAWSRVGSLSLLALRAPVLGYCIDT